MKGKEDGGDRGRAKGSHEAKKEKRKRMSETFSCSEEDEEGLFGEEAVEVPVGFLRSPHSPKKQQTS